MKKAVAMKEAMEVAIKEDRENTDVSSKAMVEQETS